MQNNLILFSCSLINILSALVIKKLKQKEKIQYQYYFFLICIINILCLCIPLSLLRKCFAILLIAPLMYQMILDYETLELSDELSLMIFIYGLFYMMLSKSKLVIYPTFIITVLYTILSILGPVGFGDVKLIIGLSLFINNYLSLLFYPMLLAVIIEAIKTIITKKRNEYFPFGPYIILSFYFVFLNMF
jgi:Flp pilus assembly protein protease CpaA